MAHEDVASLLNSMAPDDRTMFLEELPAAVTRQLLAMLTPAERSVALKLLGYPEGSIGRLMTPHYVSVREHWTIRDVLDYIRTHGQDSETLNVVYVVDESAATTPLVYRGAGSTLPAILTRSASEPALIFLMTRPRWILIVISLVPSSAATCLLSIPETTRGHDLALTRRQRGVTVLERRQLALLLSRHLVALQRLVDHVQQVLAVEGLARTSSAPDFMAITVVGMSPSAVTKMIGIEFTGADQLALDVETSHPREAAGRAPGSPAPLHAHGSESPEPWGRSRPASPPSSTIRRPQPARRRRRRPRTPLASVPSDS